MHMTNKDNGFRMRVHHENRINTHIEEERAAAIRNNDFDEWCEMKNKTFMCIQCNAMQLRSFGWNPRKRERKIREKTDVSAQTNRLKRSIQMNSLYLLKWNRESYDRTMSHSISMHNGNGRALALSIRCSLSSIGSACVKCSRRRLCVKPVSNTMNAWPLRCYGAFNPIQCNEMHWNKSTDIQK